MERYKLRFAKHFLRHFAKIKKSDMSLSRKIGKSLDKLMEDPFDPSLNTHKASTRLFGIRWSSKVSGDIRIIWDFMEVGDRILVFTVGGHAGKHKVYK